MRLACTDQFSLWNFPTTCKFFQISLTYRGKMKHRQVAFSKSLWYFFLGGWGGGWCFRSTSFCSLSIGSQGGGLLDCLLLFIKLASFTKIFKPTVAKAGKCLPMLHLCSEGRSLAYKNKQANLWNNPFLKRDRPDSQHWKFSSETGDQHFHGFTELFLYLKTAFSFAGKRSLYDYCFACG